VNTYLFYGQIVVSIILVVLVALQQRGTALGSAFGGGGEFYSSRRGMQKNLFYATVVVAGIFIVLSILNVLL